LWFSNPEQEFLDKLLRDDVDRALAALPERYRVVVIMADMEDLKYAEIAETLKIPIGTVRSRLARARAALQENAVDGGAGTRHRSLARAETLKCTQPERDRGCKRHRLCASAQAADRVHRSGAC
jgi:predicted RNA polymerase sigma factor